jgi:hypothetical protein
MIGERFKKLIKKTIRRKKIYFYLVCLAENDFLETTFQTFLCLFVTNKNLAWFPRKCFSFILDGKHFLKVVKNLKISYYLLAIYFVAIYYNTFKESTSNF